MNEQEILWKTTMKDQDMNEKHEWIKTIIEGKIERKARRGKRLRTPSMKQIIEDITKTTYKELEVIVMDKDQWKSTKVIKTI